MNFDQDEKEKELAGKVKALVDEGKLPDPEALDGAPTGVIGKTLRIWLHRLGQTGYLGAAVGEAAKKDHLALLMAQKELAQVSQWLVFGIEVGSRFLASLIADHGSAQAKTLLDPLSSGEIVGAAGISEPLSGSTPGRFETHAAIDGKDYLLNGEKSLVGLAPLADILGVVARTDTGTGLFLLERGTPGLSVGEPVSFLGYQALCVSPVTFEEVKVPADMVIGPFGDSGLDLPSEFRRAEDRALTAVSLGITWRCFHEAKKSADVVRSHGKPPAGFQSVRFSLAEMLTLAQTAELLACRAAVARCEDSPETRSLELCAKVFATENACKVSEQALQIMASGGYRRPNPVERAFRNARLGPIAGHTSEVARMAIADEVLEKLGG